MNAESIGLVGLMPHAPILVPAVARERRAAARVTIDAMAVLSRHIVDSAPDAVVVLSPHSPYRRNAAGLWSCDPVCASFGEFGAPRETLSLPLDAALVDEIERQAATHAVRTWPISARSLDHGASVPLQALTTAGWHGPVVVVGIAGVDHDSLAPLGRAIAAAATALRRDVAIIASGDMSHRLTESAPYGYHPAGPRFDATFIDLMKRGLGPDIAELGESLCDAAAEDVVGATTIGWAAVGFKNEGHRLLSYEGPFGVGYAVAMLFERGEGSRPLASSAASSRGADK